MKFAWRFVLATSLVACSSTTSHEDGAAPAELAPAMQSGGVPGGASTEVSRGAESAPICSPGELRNCGSCGEQRCRRVAKGELSGTEWGECVSLRPGRREICNGLDDDCNGLVDDGITCVDAGPPPPPPVVDAGPVEPPPSPCSERCTGASIVLDRTAAYGLWVKVALCSPTRYDLFLGPTQAGPFSKITDTNHLGQDHCELVNPAFTLPNEAAITSGTCATCDLNSAGLMANHPALFGSTTYSRANLGEPFSFAASPPAGAMTACWYECGVSF